MVHTKGKWEHLRVSCDFVVCKCILDTLPILSAYAKMPLDLRSRAYLQILKKYVVFTDMCLGTLQASHCQFALDLQIFKNHVVYLNLQISIKKSRNSRQSCICNKITQ